MITVGAFPLPEDVTNLAFSPRVGDGFIRIDASGTVEYASPNALSAYRRLGLIGDLVGEHLPTLTAALFPAGPDPVDDSVGSVLSRTQRPADRAGQRRGAHDGPGAAAARPTGTGSAPSCSAATSATCAARNASWSPRTRPSGRSTTG